MSLERLEVWLFAWVIVMSGLTLLLFGYDKWRAGRGDGYRVAESSLLLASAFGGWPGGLLGIVLFRHKSAKTAFLLKFLVALFVCAALVGGVLKLAGAF